MRLTFRPLLCGVLLLAMVAGLPLSGAHAAAARPGRSAAGSLTAASAAQTGAAAKVSGKVGRYVIPNSTKSKWTCSYSGTSLTWKNFGMPKSVMPHVSMRKYWHRRGWPAQNVAFYVLYQGKKGSHWRTWKYTELIKEVYYGKHKKARSVTFTGHVRKRSQVTDKSLGRKASSYRVVVELAWLRPTHGSPVEGKVKEIITHYRSTQFTLPHGSSCPRKIKKPLPPPIPPVPTCTGNCVVQAWGDNSAGALGSGSFSPGTSDAPVKVGLSTSVDTIGAGGGPNGYAVVNGTAYAWGDNESDELGDGQSAGQQNNSNGPVKVDIPSGVTVEQVIGGGEDGNGYALTTDGNVYAWGDDSHGQLGDGNSSGQTATPAQIAGLGNVVAIAAGSDTAYALTQSGNLYAWGDNSFGQVGQDPTMNPTEFDTPQLVTQLSGVGVTKIAAGGTAAYAWMPGVGLSAWGNNADGQLGDESDPNTEPYMFNPVSVAIGGSTVVMELAGGANDGYALTSAGNVLAWGDNGAGELGAGGGNGSFSSTPLAVSDLSTATHIAAGFVDGYALTASGAVLAWGSNSEEQLGDGKDSGTQPRSVVPVYVNGLTHATGIAAGNLTAYAMSTS